MSCPSCHIVMQRKPKVVSHSSSDGAKADGCTVCDLPLLLLTAVLKILLILLLYFCCRQYVSVIVLTSYCVLKLVLTCLSLHGPLNPHVPSEDLWDFLNLWHCRSLIHDDQIKVSGLSVSA